MKYRKIGNTGVEASVLGFGCMRLPTVEVNEEKQIDENEAIKIIRHAIDSGVNYLDTAFGYHNGKSESLVGKAVKDGYREKVSIATKLPLWNVKCEEDVDEIFATQLERLGTDHVDFYLLHALCNDSWEEKVIPFNILKKLEQKKAEGKIKHIGFSFHDDLKYLKKFIDSYEGFEFCQVQFNYLDTDYQAGIEGIEYAASKGLGVIVMEPLRGGKLACPPESVKAVLPEGKSPVEAALDYVWNRGDVSLLLSGMGSLQMVEENLAFADKAEPDMLTEHEKECIAKAKKAFEELTLIPCTGCEYCMPCPEGVLIPKVFACYNKISSLGRNGVKEEFPEIGENTSLCKKCGRCESVCPQQIKIIDSLSRVRGNLY